MNVWLGLDLGTKRVGVAIADEQMRIATPLKTIAIRGREHLVEELNHILAQYQVTEIVVGLPKTLTGDVGPAARKVMAEVHWLQGRLQPPLVLWDERLSSQEVERVLLDADLSRRRRKGIRDQLAAQRILQNYLDYRQSAGENSSEMP
ncbi:MAG: Holliday junction resolvase RuvX [Candidatus Omnitrophica bacterium]|nr:Holliday junction resolvase RuvX [Candidatus Omnitrophota bacterium]